jgi:toxin YhaV
MEANGWSLYLHPLFQQQLEKLTAHVEGLRAKDPTGYKEQPATKLLATIDRHIREIIPRDSNAAEFRQGNTLGADRHWFRAKFHERYRLFYRFSSKDKVIVYTVFHALLDAGNPPSSMMELLAVSKKVERDRPPGQQAATKAHRRRGGL